VEGGESSCSWLFGPAVKVEEGKEGKEGRREKERHADILKIYLLFGWCFSWIRVLGVRVTNLSERFGCGWNESA